MSKSNVYNQMDFKKSNNYHMETCFQELVFVFFGNQAKNFNIFLRKLKTIIILIATKFSKANKNEKKTK